MTSRTASGGRVALVTGGSRGLGRALITRLAAEGWRVVTDGRNREALSRATAVLPGATGLPGDVADPAHRAQLVAAITRLGRLDLLVNNASSLGPTPLPALADVDPADMARVLAVNTLAPLALIQPLLPLLRRSGGRIVDVSSDAAVQAYGGWGAYGASKAALDQLTAVLGVEEPQVRVYALDPGDMATDMHRAAAPDDEGLPTPESVVPAIMRLVEENLPSGRYRAQALASAVTR